MSKPRGAILLEVLIALAMFVGAGAVIVASLTTMTTGMARSRDRQVAVDLARSCLAQLEAGLITVERLHGSTFDAVPVFSDDSSARFDQDAAPQRWRVDVQSEASRFARLSIVTIRIYDTNAGPGGVEVFTLRQLVRLGGEGPEDFLEDTFIGSMGFQPVILGTEADT